MGSGLQHMNGVTALQYARSRHSTSDFSRSLRQQQVIKAIFEKLTATENLTNMNKLRELYDNFTKMVMTNVSFQESVGMMKYAYQLKNYFSHGFTSECGYGGYKMMKA
jgi:anionic cell wall polymer biosynthesis LytR-Cps2A-Psr (LCP) family protein